MKYYCSYCGKFYNIRRSHKKCFNKSIEVYRERVRLGIAGDNPYIEKDITRRD